jgi:hypothetical protein
MSIQGDLQRLHELHQAGSLTAKEYSAALAAAQGRFPFPARAHERSYAAIVRIESQLARTDREWEETRRSLGVAHGNAPSVVVAMLTGVFYQCLYGTATVVMLQSAGAIALGLLVLYLASLHVWNVHVQFQDARKTYEERRNTLLAMLKFAEMEDEGGAERCD